jgi:hypothetical protein
MQLTDPAEDVKGMHKALMQLGWKVVAKNNLDRSGMQTALTGYAKDLHSGKIGLFFYSGHGAQANGADYLLPTDFQISATTPDNISDKAISLASVLDVIRQSPTAPNIVLLDSCRDNPFNHKKGLAQPNGVPNQSIVGFAANFGSAANESGEDAVYSAYTRGLLKYIKEPGLGIDDFFKRVRAVVEEYTDSHQTPREITALKIPFAFRPAVSITGRLTSGDDEVLVLLNGEEVLSWNNDGSNPKLIPLKLGDNVISVKVYNQHTFTGGDSVFGLPEGWNYTVAFNDSAGGALLDIRDLEDVPVKDGPHHGKMFTAAQVIVSVESESDAVRIRKIDQNIWTQ